MIVLTFIALLVVVVLAMRARGRDDAASTHPALHSLLQSRWMPAVIGAITFVALWWCWGRLNPVPIVHDEIAYVLQAGIFSHGRFASPAPPFPAFWEQAHVLVEPKLAAKYPPGFPLVLAAGVLVGLPALVPLLLAGATGAMLFALARRIANEAVALLTWVIWISSPMVQKFSPGFYSETLTTALWLATWLLLLEWRATTRRRWLVLVALCIGLGAITRPLTMLAFAIPVAVVVLRDTARRRTWRDLVYALATGTLVLMLIPIASARTTGSWRVSPVALYTREYMPWDVPGFGLNATPPTHVLTRDLQELSAQYAPLHARHRPAALPGILSDRLEQFVEQMWGSAWFLFLPCALLGLFTLGGEGLMAFASSVLLVAAYLTYAASSGWTVYYLENTPVSAFLTAAGIAWGVAALRTMPGVVLRSSAWRDARTIRPVMTAAVLLLIPGLFGLRRSHGFHRSQSAFHVGFERHAQALPRKPAVMFVHYAPNHNSHLSLVRNAPDLAREPVWIVYDLGDSLNARLLAAAPGRTAYLFDEARGQMGFYAP